MGHRSRVHPGDAGDTLIELIIAVAILGIAVTAIVGSFGTAVLIADTHRKQSTAGAYARDYAESIENFVDSGHFDASASPNYGPAAVGFTAPPGFSASVAALQCWNDTSKAFVTCSAGASVQRVTATVSSNDGRASESVVLVVRQP